MPDTRDLRELLLRIDGRGYKAYKEALGAWTFPDFVLHVDHVQGDPFADPSRVRVHMPADVAELSAAGYATQSRSVGTACYLARSFAREARSTSRRLGTGRGGEIRMESPGQKALDQSAVRLHPDGSVEARFTVGLPARGRRVMGRSAVDLLIDAVPTLVRSTLRAAPHDEEDMLLHALTNEDADHLRDRLDSLELVAFVADGAVLPRRSGVDDRPLAHEDAVPFRSPESLRVEFELPNAGAGSGMGVPRGVTLLVGGGFHGKSTLLRAIGMGVYNHRPGDGREQVITVGSAVKIRAEDGRPVTGTDISSFIDGLPGRHDTRSFTTPNASGSTSQAAAIVEAAEAGAHVLLMDEDTSATNFMIRDRRMQTLVPDEDEPITPLVDRVRELYDNSDLSTVLVLGGSGDYLDVADTVVALKGFEPHDVTDRARAVADALPTGRASEAGRPMRRPRTRRIDVASLDARRGRRERYVKVPDTRTLVFGTEEVDLAAVEQIVSRAQVRTLGRALAALHTSAEGSGETMTELLDRLENMIAAHGLDALDSRRPGDLVAFRRYELASALNRLRNLALRD